MKVIGNDDFGKELAKQLGIDFIEFEQRVFPDSEVCPRIIGDVSKDVLIANHLSLPIDPNRYFIETLMLVKLSKEMGAENIDILMPYFVYSRQDKVFRKGEPFSAKFILDFLEKAGMRKFYTVSSHADRNLDRLSFSNIPAYNINGFVSIGNFLKTKLKNPLIIGPDKGAEFYAKTVAGILKCDYALLEKSRDLNTGSLEIKCNIDVSDKNVVLVDDIVSSGGTMIKAIDLLKQNGAKSISCYAVHLVSDQAIDRISENAKEFLFTDTIQTPISKISVIPELVDVINRTLHRQ